MDAARVPQHVGYRRPGISRVHGRQLPLLQHRSSSSRYVTLRAVQPRNPDIADRTKEYWDDEEDIEAAVERLGINKVQQGQQSSPLHSRVNQMYLKKTFADGFLGPLEIRHIQGKGYGLVATRDIPKGTLLAVCEPLAWVSGQPGTPPKLDTLIQHMKASRFTEQQINVLLSLSSLPDLDLAHEQQQQDRQQQQRQDRLLQAGQELEQQQEQSRERKGPAVSSYSLSKSRQLKEMQKKIMADLGQDWHDQSGVDHDLDTLDASPLRSNSDPWRSSSSSSELQRRSGQQYRRTPDVLELLECTKEGQDPAAAAAAGGGNRPSSDGSSSSNIRGRSARRVDDDGSSNRATQQGNKLRMALERLTALVLRNGHSEMSQDLTVSSIREDMPSAVTGIWPLLTMLNHSCAPNTVAVMVGEVPEQQLQQQQQPQQQLLPGEAFRRQQQQLLRSTGSSSSSSRSGPANRWAQNKIAAAKGTTPNNLARTGSSSSSDGTAALSKATAAAGSSSSSEAGTGPVILVRSVADLSSGDEVSLDYLSPGVEGSLIHPERRREALLLRWGFTCRCERCESETQLGPVFRRFQLSANSLAAKLGPQVATAVAAADIQALTAAAARLSRAVQEVEQQVNVPNIPTRVGAWAHASIYQAHALLAICRVALDASAIRSLACVGTAMELAGCVSPGCVAQLLGAAALLVASEEAWGEGDKRVEGAARGLLEVLQLRYGPLEAEAAQKLAYSAQHWAQQLLGSRLGLVAPAAATAARARAAVALAIKKQATAAAAGSSDLHQLRKDTAAAGSSDGEEDEQMAAALELDAEDVIEVTDEVLDKFYADEDSAAAAAAGSSAGVDPAAAADLVVDEPFIKQADVAAVSEDLELFTEYGKAGLSPEQREQAVLQDMQQQQQQQQQQGDPAARDKVELQQGRLTATQQQQCGAEQSPAAGSTAAAAAGSRAGGDGIMDVEAESAVDEVAVDLPVFAYLQGNLEAAEGEGEDSQALVSDTVAAASGAAKAAAAAAAGNGGERRATSGQQPPRTGKWAAAAVAAAQAAREIKLDPAAAAARARSSPAPGVPQQQRVATPEALRRVPGDHGVNHSNSGRSTGGRSIKGLGASGSFFAAGTAVGAAKQQQQQRGSSAATDVAGQLAQQQQQQKQGKQRHKKQ